MELSARIFGVNYWSLLLPQALAGVATVGALYTTVRRWFGPAAAIIAGVVMALAPVATLIFRFNDPDAFITLMAVLAAYFGTRALESGRTRWVVLTGVLFGLAFLGKMLAGFLALPGAGAGLPDLRPAQARQADLATAGRGCLAAGHRGLVGRGRPVHPGRRPPVFRRQHHRQQHPPAHIRLQRAQQADRQPGRARAGGRRPGGRPWARRRRVRWRGRGGRPGPGAGGFGGRAFGGGPGGGAFGGGTGITLLFTPEWGGQISWLIPAALIAFVAMLWVSRRGARTDRLRAAAILWGGWLVVAGLVLSFMSGTTHSVLCRRPRPADRRTYRHRRRRAVADPPHLVRAGHHGRRAGGHRRVGLGPARPQPRMVPVAARGHRRRRCRRGRRDPGRAQRCGPRPPRGT